MEAQLSTDCQKSLTVLASGGSTAPTAMAALNKVWAEAISPAISISLPHMALEDWWRAALKALRRKTARGVMWGGGGGDAKFIGAEPIYSG